MLSRTIRSQLRLPAARASWTPLARRNVTTDAATSHTDKENVPQVGLIMTQRFGYMEEIAQLTISISIQQEEDKHFSIHLSDESFETYELDPPPYELDVTKAELKTMYRDMVAIR
jgi:pyruvate dehydrogenase E1 component alpha subunit